MNNFDVGIVFNSHEAFAQAKKVYEQRTNTILVISRSERLRSSDQLSALFRYHRFTLSCKSGRERPCKSKGLRLSSTIKKNCPFEVKIILCDDKYKVKSSNNVHENHNVDQQTYKHYSENMRLNGEEIKIVEEMVKLGANKQKIKLNLMEKRNGEPISLKSIHNVQTKLRIDIHQLIAEQTELEKLLKNMNEIPNARIKVVTNDANELLGILFQDERMARVYEKYPDVLLVDATYKLNNRNIPLFILLVVDGNGESEIACLWFIKSESKECISPMIDAFQELNESWTKTKVIISDKDLADRIVFSEKFPGVPLQLCLFHALRNFNREITPAKREITALQRQHVLELLCKMAYSRSSSEYDFLYDELIDLNLPLVTKYFNENWHDIRIEWTFHGKNEWNNYLNYTTNRLESLNQKLKIIGNHYASMLSFFDNLVQSCAVISSEKDIKVVKSSMKVLRIRLDDITLQRYNELLTLYTFRKIAYEYERVDKVQFTSRNDVGAVTKYGPFEEICTTENSCTCAFYKTMQLPCRHIFQIRKGLNLDMFAPDLCAVRWSKNYYYESHPALNSVSSTTTIPMSVTKIKVPAEIDKYKGAAKVTKDINSLMSTLPKEDYDVFMEKLKHIRGTIGVNDPEPSQIEDASVEIESLDKPLDLSISNTSTNEEETSHADASGINVSSQIEMLDLTSSQHAPENMPTAIYQSPLKVMESKLAGTSSNVIDIQKIQLPLKNIRVGRPKGAGRTVVGTKKKPKKNLKPKQLLNVNNRVTRSMNSSTRAK